jgi:nucleoside-diphosphate-sugar epimerase
MRTEFGQLAGKKVAVTGGASFIGSHLVELLLNQGCQVRVIDDLSSGKISNLESCINRVEFIEYDLRDRQGLEMHFADQNTLFHLAAVHGGRGFIEKYPDRVLANLAIDFNCFEAAEKTGISRVVHASSACAYPIGYQESESNRTLLYENLVDFNDAKGKDPDGAYGWAKLMGEYQLEVFSKRKVFKGRSARIFTAYGSRENESHAVIALIAKALLKMEPFPVWGNGLQTRNFTHVSDTVRGLAHLANENSDADFMAVNVGTNVHSTVKELLEEIFTQLDWHPKEFDFQLDKPTGVKSRASDNTKMMSISHWEPKLDLSMGLAETITWYKEQVFPYLDVESLQEKLIAR